MLNLSQVEDSEMRQRDQKVEVQCDFGVSDRCRERYQISRQAAARNRGRNDGKLICLYCSRKLKFMGRSNPNAKYKSLDDSFFQTVDTEGEAYLLGWIASDGSVREGRIRLAIRPQDRALLENLRDIICEELPVKSMRDGDLASLTISSKEIARDVCHWLDIGPGPKSKTVAFPDLSSDDLRWAFLRGFFDGDGSVPAPTTERVPRCSITTASDRMRAAIMDVTSIACYHDPQEGKIEWYGNNALDFLHRLYEGATYYLQRKYERYVDWSLWVPALSGGGRYGRELHFKWTKTREEAVVPFKERASDSGYDVTILEKVKEVGRVEFFTTGIKVQPAYGWYFDLVPRSSISKTGYMMANSFGVIDRTYTGPVLVALMKVDPDAPPLDLPARIAQLVPRPIVHAGLKEVDELDETERGEGGFGSTGTE